jgi:hypothetical protein
MAGLWCDIMDSPDGFLLARIAEDERRACQRYNRDLSQAQLDTTLAAVAARRRLVAMYQNASPGCERETLARVMAVLISLYKDHPDHAQHASSFIPP